MVFVLLMIVRKVMFTEYLCILPFKKNKLNPRSIIINYSKTLIYDCKCKIY